MIEGSPAPDLLNARARLQRVPFLDFFNHVFQILRLIFHFEKLPLLDIFS